MKNEGRHRVPAQGISGSGTVAMPLELQAVVCFGLAVPVAARLRYHPNDPYAVYLDNHIDLDTPITWVFARDLLAEGLIQWAGSGDVSVFPGGCDDPMSLFISLGSEDGRVALRAQTSLVKGFLACTERVVPFGSEQLHLDIDGLLHGLLRGGPPMPGD
ncbi:SsgA family sporulation/cell division regulator [Streptomyces sp. NPDC058171]